jgi:hypothetical protein
MCVSNDIDSSRATEAPRPSQRQTVIMKGPAMSHRLLITISVGLLGGLLVAQLPVVALAVDSGAATKLPDATAPTKTVRGLIRVAAKIPGILPATDDKTDFSEFEFYKRSLASLVKSPAIMHDALRQNDINDLPLIKQHSKDPEAWLSEQIEVAFPGNGELMTVGMSSSEPEQAKKIVNAVLSSIQRRVIDVEHDKKQLDYDNLQKKFRSYQTAVVDKRRQLFEIERQAGNGQKDSANRIQRQIDHLERLAGECVRSAMQAELQIARAEHKSKGLAESPELKSIKAEIELDEVDRDFWKQKAELLTEQIGKLEEQIGKLEDQRASEKKFTGEVDQLRNEIELLQRFADNLHTTLMTLKVNLDAAPRVSVLALATVQ